MVKSMLLSKVKKGDTGDAEIDRVCLGLRMTMGWLAEAIERSALSEAGQEHATDGDIEAPKKKVLSHQAASRGGTNDADAGDDLVLVASRLHSRHRRLIENVSNELDLVE